MPVKKGKAKKAVRAAVKKVPVVGIAQKFSEAGFRKRRTR
jgi:hypothetical protein